MTEQPFGRSVGTVLDILIVTDSLRDNGGHRVAMEYGRQWVAAGSRVTIAAVQDVDEARLFRPDPTVALSFLGWPGGRLRQVLPIALKRLVALARRADVLVAGSEEGFGLLLTYAAARLTRTPFAVLVQADLDSSIGIWVPRALQGCTRFVHTRCAAAICVADSIVPGVLANGLPPERVSVVLNGVDVEHGPETGRARPARGLRLRAEPDPAGHRSGDRDRSRTAQRGEGLRAAGPGARAGPGRRGRPPAGHPRGRAGPAADHRPGGRAGRDGFGAAARATSTTRMSTWPGRTCSCSPRAPRACR